MVPVAPAVVFICSANLCRSPMAQAIFAAETARRGLTIAVTSAGIRDFDGAIADADARRICEQHGTPMPKTVATHLSNVDLSQATRVFAMEERHVGTLLEETRLSREQISLMGEFDLRQRGAEIADPMGQDLAAFELCYVRLRDCIVHYLDTAPAAALNRA
jgi:protein-tyrosine-phosphatase